nr:beta-glucosidase [uncultured bacterium]
MACVLAAFAGCTNDSSSASQSVPVQPATVHPEKWPAVQPPLGLDAAQEARIDELLAAMTLEQKVGQLIQADVASVTPEDLRRYPLGAILNGGNSGPGGNDLAPASEWLAAADAYYDAALDPAHGPQPIPILWGIDAVHGHNNIIGATIFPHNIGLGATRNKDLVRKIGEITARELAVTGQDWTFAPTLAVVRDDRWGRTYEGYSEDPEIVVEYASAMVEGLQGRAGTAEFLGPGRAIATAKHFLGDGGTQDGKDQGDNRATEEELRDIHAAGYVTAIRAGVQTVMASFSSWQGAKMHGHRGLLTDVLKGRMGFDGFVVGDWNAHGQVPGCSNTRCAIAINAGVDMLMAPDSWKDLYENTLAQVKSGEISMQRLEDAVRRILRVKLRAGLFEKGRPSSRPLAGQFRLLGAPEHRAVARQAVRESLVLLKNQNGILPLAPRQHVLVAGDGADNIPKQCGGWTLSWQGTGVTNEHFPNAESIYAGIRRMVLAAGGTVELAPDGRFKRRPDVAIVVFGEDPYAEFRGDLLTVEYKPGDKSDLALLRRLKEQGIPVVSVFLSGRPLWVNPEINASDAFVAAWLPGSEGGGIADVLFRRPDGSINHDFRGKLSFSWPRSPTQTRVNRGDGGEPPLFPYGYGLTYSDDGNLDPLPEETGAQGAAAVSDTSVFFAKGRMGSGWQWFVGDAGAARVLAEGGGAASDGSVQVVAVDHAMQEDARQIRWTAPARAGISGTEPIDLQREANGQLALAFDYRVDEAPAADVHVAIECGPECGGRVPIRRVLSSAPPGQWGHLKIPLSCFEKAGADMRRVTAPFVISSEGRLTLSVSNVLLETGTDGTLPCTG